MSRCPDHPGKRVKDHPCANPHCDKNAMLRAEGELLCNKHYLRWRAGRDYMGPDQERHKACVVDGCGKPVRSGYSKYCEKHYGRLRRGVPLVSETDAIESCIYCGSRLPKGKHKFCADRCASRHARGAPLKINCPECGVEFYPLDRHQVCSEACHKKRVKRWDKLTRERNLSRIDVQMKNRNREYIRRAKANNSEWEMFDTIKEVFDRDKWTCQICGDPVDKDAKWPEKNFPSLDHIIPLSAGGSHTPDNCQTTHLGCNLRKARTQDVKMAAKVKRMAGETGQRARRERAKAKGTHRPIQSRNTFSEQPKRTIPQRHNPWNKRAE